MESVQGRIVAVARDDAHGFAKPVAVEITLLEGIGVEGDAHAGRTVQHRSRVRRDPSEPNLRQVHLIHSELFDEVAEDGFEVAPGMLGENVTTRGIDLLALPEGTVLRLGQSAVVRVTGLRNPCAQIDGVGTGLMKRLSPRKPEGGIRRLAGVMSVVVAGGPVRAGDTITVELPVGEHRPLEPV
ncbi:MOSC domain-containing protein [Okibacterium endophyticum]